jgi:hypothetical protein
MRVVLALLSLLLAVGAAQDVAKTNQPKLVEGAPGSADQITIPAGTKIPVALKNAISTKSNQQGDPVYAQTTFPVVLNERIVIPAGTYMQGRIMQVKPAGRIKGRAEVMMHFTTLIYPSGYTVMLPGSLENAPAVDKAKVKDKEGTIRADSDKGTKAAEVAIPAAEGGALAGGLARGTRGGTAIGAGLGAAVGVGIAMLSHGNDVKLAPGTTLAVSSDRIRAAAQ